MSKINVTVSAPVDTYSGYGARSRDFIKALLKSEKYDIKILSQRWGNTRAGYLEDHNEAELQSLIVPNLTEKPDVWFQITVPNEFQPVGKYNIGVTAGIETTICDPSWIEGCNRMDMIMVSSNHAKETFERSKFDIQQNGQITSSISLQKPVEVVFEGVDLEKYFPVPNMENTFNLSSIKESFAFLFVGTWLQGDFGQDRKNVGLTIKAFLEVFKNKKNPPALILKTQQATSSILDRDKLLTKIDNIRKSVKGTLPNIYLIHGELSDEELNMLYSHPKIKAMVNLTKGEGFGRPLLEFSLHKKPIITTGWSGHTDFLNPEFTSMVKGELENVHPSAVVKNMILAESQWFKPDTGQAGGYMKDVFKNYKKYKEQATRQAYYSKTNFSWEKMAELIDEILSRSLPEFPKQIPLQLPKLKLPELQKLEDNG